MRNRLDANLRPIPRIDETDEIEAAIQSLEEDINNAIEQSTPQVKKARSNKYGEIPPVIKTLVTKKNRAKRIAQGNRDPEDKCIANALNREIKVALRKHFNDR